MLWRLLCKVLCKYGTWAANSASIHGAHESEVPAVLQKKAERKKN